MQEKGVGRLVSTQHWWFFGSNCEFFRGQSFIMGIYWWNVSGIYDILWYIDGIYHILWYIDEDTKRDINGDIHGDTMRWINQKMIFFGKDNQLDMIWLCMEMGYTTQKLHSYRVTIKPPWDLGVLTLFNRTHDLSNQPQKYETHGISNWIGIVILEWEFGVGWTLYTLQKPHLSVP